MNPTFTVSIDTEKRKASAVGLVAVGEKVDVVVTGLDVTQIPAWEQDNDEGFTGPSLRFRLVSPDGKDLVRFPLAEGDAWTVNEDGSLSAEVDFNTMPLRHWFHGYEIGAKAEVGMILDSVVDAMEYGRGTVKILQWTASPAEDPTILPDWRKTLRDLNAAIVEIKDSVDLAEGYANDAEASAGVATEKAGVAETAANNALSSASAAEGFKSDAESAATDARGYKDDAETAADTATTKAGEAADSARDAAQILEDIEEAIAGKAEQSDLEAEAARATQKEEALEDGLTEANDTISANTDAIGQLEESKADKTAINTLSDAIDSEAETREEKDAAICAKLNQEIGNRQAADNTLSTAISNLSASKADKATTYTKTEVDTKIAGVQTFQKYLVQTRPAPEAADMKGLYLVPTGETTEEGDLCEEWTVVEEDGEKRWEKIGAKAVDLTLDNAVTRTSANGVKSSGIWSAIWGALTALPTGFSSLYDWVVAQLAGTATKEDATLTEGFSEWTVTGLPDNAYAVSVRIVEDFGTNVIWELFYAVGATPHRLHIAGLAGDVALDFGDGIVATCCRQLVLGSQSTKPIQPAGDYASAAQGEKANTALQGVKVGSSPVTPDSNRVVSLGTAAAKNVPASGDASSTQVVMGNDSRLPKAEDSVQRALDNATPSAKTAVTVGTRSTENAADRGQASLTVGDHPKASGPNAVATGTWTEATAPNARADGNLCKATNNGAHGEGNNTQATGPFSHTEGSDTAAPGLVAHAEGNYTTAEGTGAHTEGMFTKASGPGAHAEGSGLDKLADLLQAAGASAEIVALLRQAATDAAGSFSHTEGLVSATSEMGSHAQGFRASDGGNPFSFVWQGYSGVVPTAAQMQALLSDPTSQDAQAALQCLVTALTARAAYTSKGRGTFCINPAPQGGSTDPKTGFFVGDESLDKALRYSFHAATVSSGATPAVTSLADRAINTATLGSTVTAATVTLPAATAGYSRDFFIDLTIEAADAPTLTFIDPATGTTANVALGADSLADIAPGYNLVLWTELPNNRWLVSVKHEEAS